MGRDAKEIICPFYKDETRNSIRCESIISDTCSNNFTNAKEKEKHRKNYCLNFNYPNCPLARILLEKYVAEDVREKEEKHTELYKIAQEKGGVGEIEEK